MPLSIVAEFLFQGILEAAFYAIGYLTGRVIVFVFTFGKYSVEPFVVVKEGKKKKRKKPPKQIPPKPFTLSTDAGVVIGLLFWAVLGVGVYFLYRIAKSS